MDISAKIEILRANPLFKHMKKSLTLEGSNILSTPKP
jgi:hypothetical protein